MRPSPWAKRRGDVVALAALLAIILVTVGFRFVYDNWLSQFDIFTFFLPNFTYVGDRLRSFQVPAWNPYFSSGTPMAGDAGGGWLYLPAMVAFAIFNTATAMKIMVLLQTLIGALATYLLARKIGLVPLAALFAATALAVGPALYDATSQSTVIGQISAWMPVGIAGAECALQARRWSARLAWSGVTGVGLVELFAAWPQGFLYGAMLIGGWVLYRAILTPPDHSRSRTQHLTLATVCGGASAIFALGLGAAAILPRLEFSAESNIPGGDYSHVIGGNYVESTYSWLQLLGLYLGDTYFWRIIQFSGVILLLGVLALLIDRRRYHTWFFLGATLLFLDLAASPSLTRPFFYLVPTFKTIHSHRPTATMYMVYLPFAMLAGAGVQAILTGELTRQRWLRWLLPMPIMLLAYALVARFVGPVSWIQVTAILAATCLIALVATRPHRSGTRHAPVPRLVGVALLLISLAWPSGWDFLQVVRDPQNYHNNLLGANARINRTVDTVLARHEPVSAGSLLQYFRDTQPPFRFAAYFGSGSRGFHNVPSSGVALQPPIVAILANARSVQLGLEQISGYNPMHLKDYFEYVTAMNGVEQNYHWLDVYEPALDSQLLDMLNVCYILVPANLRRAPPIADYGTVVYRDNLVVVYENPRAFPRAWIVHDVRQDYNGMGLSLLARGQVDGRAVAFVTGKGAPASAAPQPQARPDPGYGPAPARPFSWTPAITDRVDITSLQPERISMRATSNTAGFLVVSEPYATGWNAYLDGKRVTDVRTDHALQGVALPAGNHTVVLKYEPRSLAIGLPVSGGTTVMMVGVWAWAIADRRRGAQRHGWESEPV